MNQLIEEYWNRALKIARQYETGEVDFADLTGFSEEFAASFSQQLGDLPEPQRASASSALESTLEAAITSNTETGNASEALSELLISLNRTPIY